MATKIIQHHEQFDFELFFQNISLQYIGLDYRDYLAFLHADGEKHSFIGHAECDKRVENAIGNAIASGHGADIINRASTVMIMIIHSSKAVRPLTMNEMQYLNEFTSGFSKECELIWGVADDSSLENSVKAIVFANIAE